MSKAKLSSPSETITGVGPTDASPGNYTVRNFRCLFHQQFKANPSAGCSAVNTIAKSSCIVKSTRTKLHHNAHYSIRTGHNGKSVISFPKLNLLASC